MTLQSDGAVIFDLNGTLVPLASSESTVQNLTECARILDIETGTFIHHWRATFTQRNSGGWGSSTEHFIAELMNLIGAKRSWRQVKSASEARRRFAKETVQPSRSTVQVLGELRSLGEKIGLLSVCGITLVEVWPSLRLSAMVDLAYFSAQRGILKPDPRCYLTVCDELGISTSQAIFVGDGAGGELEGAERVGIVPVLFENQSSTDAGLAPEQWTGYRINSLADVTNRRLQEWRSQRG